MSRALKRYAGVKCALGMIFVLWGFVASAQRPMNLNSDRNQLTMPGMNNQNQMQ